MMNVEKFIDQAVSGIRDAAGGEKVVMALSGGVDSSVCAALGARAIGDRLIPIYVDTGLMRKGETERIRSLFADKNLRVVDAADEFFEALAGVTDPEGKRKAIGEKFIRVFEREAKRTGATMLLQGTIYPDRIESEGGIKSHHNVGGMPLNIDFKGVIEPLADLYKDEVREVAAALGLPAEIQHRMPFPGPGLAVRVLGEGDEREDRDRPGGKRHSRGVSGGGVRTLAVFCRFNRSWHRCQGGRPASWLDSRCPGGPVQGWNDRRSTPSPLRDPLSDNDADHSRDPRCLTGRL